MKEDADKLILRALGVSEVASGIAQQVLDLQDEPNVKSVTLEGRASKLLWKIEMEKPFQTTEELEAYLDGRGIPYTGIIADKPCGHIFDYNPYTPDNIRGVFF